LKLESDTYFRAQQKQKSILRLLLFLALDELERRADINMYRQVHNHFWALSFSRNRQKQLTRRKYPDKQSQNIVSIFLILSSTSRD